MIKAFGCWLLAIGQKLKTNSLSSKNKKYEFL